MEQLIINVVLLLPPNDSWRIRVNFESLYGIWTFFLEDKADITLPKVDKDKFMALASLRL